MLANAHDAALAVTQDAPVSRGLGESAGEERQGRFGARLDQGAHRFGLDQRHVTVEDHHPTLEIVERLERALSRVSGSVLLRLKRRSNARPTEPVRLEDGLDLFLFVAKDDDDALRTRLERNPNRPDDHRHSGHFVHHFGERTFHSRALSGGEHDHREVFGVAHRRRVPQ